MVLVLWAWLPNSRGMLGSIVIQAPSLAVALLLYGLHSLTKGPQCGVAQKNAPMVPVFGWVSVCSDRAKPFANGELIHDFLRMLLFQPHSEICTYKWTHRGFLELDIDPSRAMAFSASLQPATLPDASQMEVRPPKSLVFVHVLYNGYSPSVFQ